MFLDEVDPFNSFEFTDTLNTGRFYQFFEIAVLLINLNIGVRYNITIECEF